MVRSYRPFAQKLAMDLLYCFALLAVLEELKVGKVGGEDVAGLALAISNVAADKMGGTSGALYSYVHF